MPASHCPGQDQLYWKPEDIFAFLCSYCDTEMESWKDEPVLDCPHCKKLVRNPKLDPGCAEWCKYAEECPGKLPD